MRNAQACLFTLLSVSIYILFIPKLSNAVDTITPSLSISDGETNETIVSAAEQFELGFFSPRDSKNRYLGIWFKKVQPQTVVWVANRDNPITNSTGVLKISDNGNLELVDQTSSVVWSSNVTGLSNSIVQLLDTGNLVIREGGNTDTRDFLWQSFDHPTDTLLPHMKLGWDLRSGLDRMLTSWKAPNDPAAGDYSVKVVLGRFPQSFAYNKQVPTSRTGSWNGLTFTGVPQINQSFIFSFDFTLNQYESYYSFSLKNGSIYSRLVLSSSGQLQRMTWLEKDQSWDVYWYYPKDPCDSYKKCGDNGICSFKDSQTCTCLEGYQPKNPQDWFLRDGSGGCIQKTKYECQKNDGFLHLKQMKLPDTSNSFIDSSLTLKDCEAECIRNCSCKAYANSNITNGGSGCIIWVDDLVDLRDFNIGGQDLYVRVADSLLGNGGNKDSTNDSKKKKPVTLIVIATVIPAIFLVVLGLCFALRKKKTITMPIKAVGKGVSHEGSQELPLFDVGKVGSREYSNESKDELELPVFGLYTVETATYNFSNANKLGEGGFGSVYKGTLEDGQQIAVKSLSKNSTQGVEEFKNEVVLIARLQHRNLVRLLGCCVEGDEKILIYEYLQNKSLDSIIFDKSSSLSLDWQQRFNIVLGIARGLLYLHQDSRFRIIHRDLKASNVLLDADMNPKISDFGMARIFGGDQTEANTMRVVGTYGYMSPEYAMDGLFSFKSDVFSFGVLVLEIVSGMKNRGYYSSSDQNNLLGNAWKQWREGNALEQLIDASVEDDSTPSEVLRCIQVGLLCVQERAEDRPNMASVLLMLSSEFPSMPQPKQPGFWFATGLLETEASSSNPKSSDSNQVTVTMLQARE